MERDEYLDEMKRLWPEPGQIPAKEIVDLLLEAVAAFPESSDLWYNLGIIMDRCGDEYGYTHKDYLRCYENAIRCDPENAEAFQELGIALDVYCDDFVAAERALKQAIELGAGSESYEARARALAQMGKTQEALDSVADGNCPYSTRPEIQKLRAEIANGDWCWGPPTGSRPTDR